MGGSQSQGVYSVLDIQHPELRNFKGITKDENHFMSASIATQKPQFYQWKNQVKQFKDQVQDTQSILLPLKHQYDQGGVCSTTGELTIDYQYFPKLLSAQIRDRMRSKKKFTEAQLWYLLYVIASARQALMSQGYQVGDLQPRNIFLNANQQVKVACRLSWPNQVSAYRKAVLQQGYGYLAPQDMVRLKLGAMDNKQNTESQIFSMGLTMLSASVLQPMKDLYSVKQNALDEQLFNSRLSLFQQDRGYSDIYRAVVSNMLQMDPQQRMSQQQIAQFLFKHKDNLKSQKPLMFDNVGRRLQQSINDIVKKNNGVSDNTSRYSAVSSLYTISKQNTVRNHQPQEDIGKQTQRQHMRQSEPNNQNVINYELRKEGQVVSPRAQQRAVFSQPGSPPETGTPKQTPPRPITPQQSPNKQQIATPSFNNTPTKPPPPSGTIISQGPPINTQGIPINGANFNQQANSRPIVYQQIQNGRPVSHQPINNGSGVIFSKQPPNNVVHVSGQVTPPHPITPLYSHPYPQPQPYPQPRPQPQLQSHPHPQPLSQLQSQSHPQTQFQPQSQFQSQPQKLVTIPKNQQPQQVYSPFQNIGKNVTFGPSQAKERWAQESKATEIDGETKSINNLLMQTKKGAFVEMSQIKRKKSPSNSQLQPNQIENKCQEATKQIQSKVQDQEEAWIQIQPAKIQENIDNKINAQNEVKQIFDQTPSQKLNDLMKDAQKEIQAAKEAEKIQQQAAKAKEKATEQIEKVEEQSKKVTEQSKKVVQEVKKQIVEKRQLSPGKGAMSPSIKVWGIQKGKLTIQAGNSEKQKQTQSYAQGVKQLQVAPTSIIKTKTSQEEPANQKLQDVKVDQKIQAKTPEEQDHKKQQKEEIKQEQKEEPERQQTEEGKSEQKEEVKKQQPKQFQTQKLQPKSAENYILIEQPSRTSQKVSQVQQEQNKLFVFSSKTTNGTYDQCWKEVQKMLVTPQQYCSKIDSTKVQPFFSQQHGQFIKVGPAALKIHKNKEQGKIWGENLPTSKTQGDFLMGVIKDGDKKHCIWINSSLKYKEKHFPSQQILQQALSVAQRNINTLHD